MTALIFLDTETTGLRPDIHTPWEIAWKTAVVGVAPDGFGTLRVVNAYQSFVHLTREEALAADQIALDVGKFERWSGEHARSSGDLMNHLSADCSYVAGLAGVKVPHLVGAVPSFDHAMLTRWMGWPGFGESPYHYHLVDVEALAAGRLNLQPPWDSDSLNAYLGIEVRDKHTAMGDVNWSMAMYAAVFNLTIEDAT